MSEQYGVYIMYDEDEKQEEKIKQPPMQPKKQFIPDFGEKQEKNRRYIILVIVIAVVLVSVSIVFGMSIICQQNNVFKKKEKQAAETTEMPAETELMQITEKPEEPPLYMPDVKGMKQQKAKNKLKELGLVVKITKEYGSITKGKVMTQSIKAGDRVKEKMEVVLIVSKGKKPENNASPSYKQKKWENTKTTAPQKSIVTEKPVVTQNAVTTKKPDKKEDDVDWEIIEE